MTLEINSVAVIGCGPAGLATLYELLHTAKDGTSTVGDKAAKNPKFAKVVGFEQKHKAGGIWAPSFSEADLPIPPQHLLDADNYNDPDAIHPRQDPPGDLCGATNDNPVKAELNQSARELEWSKSGIFKNLFTNIPSRFIRFSYMENDAKYYDKSRTIYPFMSHLELCSRMDKFVESEGLDNYIRYNSRIQDLDKTSDGKWKITVRRVVDEHHEEWYQEVFDAVVVATGHYSIPNYPRIKGLAEFNRNFPGSLLHANSYRTPEEFRDQRVLVIGGSISTINILQYIVPVAKSVTVSSRGNHKIFPWLDKAVRSEGIDHKFTIKEINGETGQVLFNDGSSDSRYDKIVFTTGYHYHYPFVKDYIQIINPSNSSRVSGLYYNTFAIEDPTLAFNGVAASTVNFQTMETGAAFIAGVWSGSSKLPSKEVQKKWEADRRALKGDGSSFHYYFHNEIKPDYIDAVEPYFAKGRKNPLHIDGDHLTDVEIGIESIEKLFYNVKTQRLLILDTVYTV